MNSLLRVLDRLISLVMKVCWVVLIGLSIYFMLDSFYLYKNSKEEFSIEKADDLAEGAIGWIKVDNTKIDYPIMQGETNFDYIETDPYGNYSLAGSIFLDFRNDSSFNDAYSMLYGHNMSMGNMFGSLRKFKNAEYVKTHRTGKLVSLLDNKEYSFTVFAVCVVDAMKVESDVIFENFDLDNLISYLEENSLFYDTTGSTKSKVLGLSTCESPDTYGRICVFGYLE